MRKLLILLTIFSISALSCTKYDTESGVSKALASHRAKQISEVRYTLSFDIPETMQTAIEAEETISFKLKRAQDVVLDFKEGTVKSIEIKGSAIEATIASEHITIPAKYTRRGENSINISFTASDMSLNRRASLLYTLLVPDRARTLFPCFDQPDMKASYSLSLSVPEAWTAVSNTAIVSESVYTASGEQNEEQSARRTIHFGKTEPLSTYLFSFVAGEFTQYEASRGGRTIHLYHRETEEEKIAQCPEVARQVFDALDYMEEYLGVPYPFAKYDLVVMPDFQYGGMEHTGATLYNDRRIFLPANPTTDELLARASLIAHETAHMWFGDYVTMRWFDDVWTKEVFANWFAARMIRPQFPQINHHLTDLKSYYAASYEEDRTAGANAIRRPLDNLNNAGLIYGAIIYDKAPVVMEMIRKKMGDEALRKGLSDYVRKYAYANANWDELIACLSPYCNFDIKRWSHVWIDEKGMPEYELGADGILRQSDPFGSGNSWDQVVSWKLDEGHFIPNIDANAYGYFKLSSADAAYIMDGWSRYADDENLRMALLQTLYENCWRGELDEARFVQFIGRELAAEANPLIFSSMLTYSALPYAVMRAANGDKGNACCTGNSELESTLRKFVRDESQSSERRTMVLRRLTGSAVESASFEMLYAAWETGRVGSLSLSERDRTRIAQLLMIAMPDRHELLYSNTLKTITNPDRREAFEWTSRACSATREERDAFFHELLSREGREIESRALTALGLMCHRLRPDEAVERIAPALSVLEDAQKSGDIFFPASWCDAIFAQQYSREAYEAMKDFETTDLLTYKVRQSAGWLLREYGQNR